jgi:predicted nucleic acid-binding protein
VATRKKGLLGNEAQGFLRDWIEVFPVINAGPATLLRATEAAATHRLAFWDALLWATAREAGCRWLVSEDFQDGRELGGVRFVDPFAGPLPAELERALAAPR